MTSRTIGIAAGMLLDVADPADCVAVAADAGFDALGLRFVGDPPDAAALRRVRQRLDDTGLVLLDFEMVRFVPEDRAARVNAQVVDVATELRPRHLTTVVYHDDLDLAVEQLGRLCDAVNTAGVVPALEFLPFSGVRTWPEARRMVAEVGTDRAAVLVDSLHVTRSGDVASSLQGAGPELVPYAQFCDAPAEPADGSDEGLYLEAVGGRLLPGSGGLPLLDFLRALPAGIPLSVEVLSDDLMADLRPAERAAVALAATQDTVARMSAPDGTDAP